MFRPNPWGLSDVHGNVREWCEDGYGPYPAVGSDPVGSTGRADVRVVRAGSWGNYPGFCRSASRDWVEPDDRSYCLGLRVCFHPPAAWVSESRTG